MNVEELKNVINSISKQWMLVSAVDEKGKANAMTASWGGVGELWGKDVVFVFIRPQRYTKEFVDKAQTLSLSFFDESYRKMYNYMGSKSGRDFDKIKEQNLTVTIEDGAPVFAQAEHTIIAKKLYVQRLEKECFLDKTEIEKWYKANDYHDMYIAEIINIK